ncbi:MAG: hypothetical protein M0P61_18200 [Ignavibacteriaceae bacterium]|jgi:hypothetical protein|nr:hypothetical protein [Ignavibacteriaceae bacterium]
MEKKNSAQTTLDKMLEAIALFPLDDQLIISDIVHKRVIEEQRKLLANSVKESLQEYNAGLTKSGSVNDFLNDVEAE